MVRTFGPPARRDGTAGADLHDRGLRRVAVVPLVVRGSVPGQEIEYPMALVILGGLVTSTAMTLFPLPSLHDA